MLHFSGGLKCLWSKMFFWTINFALSATCRFFYFIPNFHFCYHIWTIHRRTWGMMIHMRGDTLHLVPVPIVPMTTLYHLVHETGEKRIKQERTWYYALHKLRPSSSEINGEDITSNTKATHLVPWAISFHIYHAISEIERAYIGVQTVTNWRSDWFL